VHYTWCRFREVLDGGETVADGGVGGKGLPLPHPPELVLLVMDKLVKAE